MLTRRNLLALGAAGIVPAFVPHLRAQSSNANNIMNSTVDDIGAFWNALKHGHPNIKSQQQRAIDAATQYNNYMKQTGGFQQMDQQVRTFDPFNRPRITLSYAKSMSDGFKGRGIDMSWDETFRYALQAGRTKWDGLHKVWLKAGAQAVHEHFVDSLVHFPLPPNNHPLVGQLRRNFTPLATPVVRAAYQDVPWDQVGCPCYCPDGTQAWNNYGGGCPSNDPPPDNTTINDVSNQVAAVYINPVPTPDGSWIDPVGAAVFTVVGPTQPAYGGGVVGAMAPNWLSNYNNYVNNTIAWDASKKEVPNCTLVAISSALFGLSATICGVSCVGSLGIFTVGCMCALLSGVGAAGTAIYIATSGCKVGLG